MKYQDIVPFEAPGPMHARTLTHMSTAFHMRQVDRISRFELLESNHVRENVVPRKIVFEGSLKFQDCIELSAIKLVSSLGHDS